MISSVHVIRVSLFSVLLLTLLPGVAAAQDDVAERISAMMETAYGGDEPGAAVLVMEGDDVLIAEGYGLADLEWGIANTARTSFRIGSISKPFTAIAILQQVDAGRLDLDMPASTYLPDLPGVLGEPTLRQLLSHTSGLPDHFSLPVILQIMRNPITPDEIIALMRDAELMFEPGSRWSYSNFNYVLLGRILTAVDPEGRDYGRYVEEMVFAPLGMINSHYDRQSAVIPRRARGYDHDGSAPVNTITVETSLADAAGALMTSAEDLALFARALAAGEVLSAEMQAEAWTDAVLNDGSGTGYGLGFNISEFLGERAIWHNGSTNGFQAAWIYLPESGRTVAVLSNGFYRSNTTTMARRIHAELAGLSLPGFVAQAIDDAVWMPVEGRYELDDGRTLQIHVQDGVRYNIDGDGWDELSLAGEDVFFIPDSLRHIVLRRDANGSATGLTYFTSSLAEYSGERIVGDIEGAQRSIPLDPAMVATRVGDWAMASGDLVRVRFQAGDMTLQLSGQPPYRLHASDASTYFVRGMPVSIRFAADGDHADLTLWSGPFELTRN
jgi:CubicO group peptidase (beta-lactamase class C family)